MEFLKNNLRGIVITLLVAGLIIGIASLASDDTTDSTDTATSSQNEETENAEGENNEEVAGESTEGNSNEESSEGSSDNAEAVTSEVTEQDGNFKVSVLEGGNQTVAVRRVVDNYLNSIEAELSAEQKLYVETNLVNDLGRTDFVAVGEFFSLSEEQVKQRVDEAQQLSDDAIARWSVYL